MSVAIGHNLRIPQSHQARDLHRKETLRGRAPDKRRESVTKSLVSLGKSAEKKLSREEKWREEGPETKLEESSRARIGRRINAGLRDMSASSRNLAYELVRVQPMCGGHVVVAAGSLRLRLSLLLLLLRPQ